MIERLFAIAAEVAARHALAARTIVRVYLHYEADLSPSFASARVRVLFGDQLERNLDIKIPAGAAPDLDAFRQLVDAEIERFRWRNRRPAA